MKILITGGAGYIGTSLVKMLVGLQQIENIIIYDNLMHKNYGLFFAQSIKPSEKISYINGDILDSRKIGEILPTVDAVVHLAAKVTTPFANDDPHYFEQVNHWGTAEIVYAAEKSDLQKFIYLSSAAVYGYSDSIVDENTIPRPKTAYAISKLRGESHVVGLKDKMETVIIRCGNVFGFSPSMRLDAVINRIVFESYYFRKISINGTGEQQRAFIHLNSVVKNLADILKADSVSGIYNLVTENISINKIALQLKEFFPDLDILYLNQHISFNSIKVKPCFEMTGSINIKQKSIFDSLSGLNHGFNF